MVEKPHLTDDHKTARKVWARRYYELLSNPESPVCFLDEKWFYTTSRRRQLKILPKGEHEIMDPHYQAPKIRSRRYPVKVMYLGVVASPHPNHDFDGRVFLKRVSNTKTLTRSTRNKRFSIDVLVNDALKNGMWKDIAVEGMSIGGLLNATSELYDIDDFIRDHLELIYHTGWSCGLKVLGEEKYLVSLESTQM